MRNLESVNLELLGLGDADLDQELANVVSLIALKLHYFTVLWMLHHCSVTGELLLACLDDLLLVVVVGDSLDGGQCLASVSLLDSNVN